MSNSVPKGLPIQNIIRTALAIINISDMNKLKPSLLPAAFIDSCYGQYGINYPMTKNPPITTSTTTIFSNF